MVEIEGRKGRTIPENRACNDRGKVEDGIELGSRKSMQRKSVSPL